MDPITIAVALGATVAGAGAGAFVARRRHDEVPAAPATDGAELRRLRDRAATFEAELRTERAKLSRVTSLGGAAVEAPSHGRASRGSLQPFATRLLELGPVRHAMVVTRDGLPATRADTSLDLAALVPALRDDSLREVRVVTGPGDHVTLRRLPAWTDGAWLLLQGVSGFVNPVALDLVTLDLSGAAPTPSALTDRGREGQAGELLAGLLGGANARTIALLQGAEVVARASDDGLDEAATAREAELAADLWRRGAHLARGPLSALQLGFADGHWSNLIPVEDPSSVLAVTVGEPIDELAARRLGGALRRTNITTHGGDTGAIAS